MIFLWKPYLTFCFANGIKVYNQHLHFIVFLQFVVIISNTIQYVFKSTCIYM
jgi:hypothetical protein